VTIRVDGKEPREVVVPGWYLDGRSRGERNCRVDLAYATTGHRAQGLTRWRALVRLTGPEPQGPAELDLPDREVIEPLADPGAHGGDPAEAFEVIAPLSPASGSPPRPSTRT